VIEGRFLQSPQTLLRSRFWIAAGVMFSAMLAVACPSKDRPVPSSSTPGARPAKFAENEKAKVSADKIDATARASIEDAAAPASDAAPRSEESLTVEESDRDPRSEMVTIKLNVEPPKHAHVFWGTKDLGVAPLEIRRPRGSGPLDLVLRAPGFLTFHTRAFTDRDDRIAIRLIPEAEASRVFGYRNADIH
jgi:hypothetical protein